MGRNPHSFTCSNYFKDSLMKKKRIAVSRWSAKPSYCPPRKTALPSACQRSQGTAMTAGGQAEGGSGCAAGGTGATGGAAREGGAGSATKHPRSCT